MSEIAIWSGGKDAALYLDVSRDTIETYAVRWPKDGKPVKGRFRYKELELKPGSDPRRRYYRPDLDARLN